MYVAGVSVKTVEDIPKMLRNKSIASEQGLEQFIVFLILRSTSSIIARLVIGFVSRISKH